MKPVDILETAASLVGGDRAQQYGDYTVLHQRVADLWGVYLKTEIKPEDEWADVTRRETIEGAEQAIDSSVEHYAKKLDHLKGPKVVKTFE
jgi:hypothetical protein